MYEYSRQILEISTKKSMEDIKKLIANALKQKRFHVEKYNNEDVICYSDLGSYLMDGIKTYLKFYIKEGNVIIVGWARRGKREFSFGESVDLNNYVSNKRKTGSLSDQLYGIMDLLKEPDSIVKCYNVDGQLINFDMYEQYVPNFDRDEKIQKSVFPEIILNILSIVCFFFNIYLSIIMVLISICRIYYSGFYKNQKKLNKFVFVCSVILLIIYIVFVLFSIVANVMVS